MSDETDPFGYRPAQGSLFGGGEKRMQAPQRRATPDPETVRLRLQSLVAKARAAERMPWSERDARMWQIVFPNMPDGCRTRRPSSSGSRSRAKWSGWAGPLRSASNSADRARQSRPVSGG
jgi:hypothetical protein